MRPAGTREMRDSWTRQVGTRETWEIRRYKRLRGTEYNLSKLVNPFQYDSPLGSWARDVLSTADTEKQNFKQNFFLQHLLHRSAKVLSWTVRLKVCLTPLAQAEGPVIWRMLTYPPVRRALIVGCGLQMFQQLSGINTVMYYSATILQMSGVRDDKLAIWLVTVTAFTNFLFTLLGVWLVERVGRRRLTLGSIFGTVLSLCVLAVGFLLSAQYSPPVTQHLTDPTTPNSSCTSHLSCEPCMLDPSCGYCYQENNTAVFASSCVPVNPTSTERAAWGRCANSTHALDSGIWAYNFCPTSYSWVVLLGLVLYIAFFAPGMGPMPWTVNSEIYPLWARSTGNACSAGVNWTFNVLVSLTFLHMAQYLTYYGAFFLYSSFALIGLFFIYGCLPETKGRRLEEIESLFENQLCSCGITDSDEDRQVEYIRVKGSNYHLSDNDASDVE
ncbi:Proton myo-inositol cotransporter [Triplophysa tibetana]|uniref:Proton myo-inositol cotransporter n=1 Tax=Triplophysa tibetana TaxID=1572043 RepID=A0A5A9PHE1_9TELE|nr:Proton myo-inositol cotransporter [Triplophysa tibetana]